MEEIPIGPLTPGHASTLARDLIVKEEIACESQDSVSNSRLCESVVMAEGGLGVLG
jgi:hypothetical protein